jgi:hypothetical protein
MLRFKRDFELTIADNKSSITIKPPIRISFEASKSLYRSANSINLQIFNLKKENRNIIVKDAEDRKFISINLKVGYQGSIETIYNGQIYRGYIAKQGNEILSIIQSLDGGYGLSHGFANETVKTKNEAISAIANKMEGVTIAQITKQNNVVRPIVLVGNCGKLLQQQIDPNQAWMIDSGKLYALKQNEYIGNKNLAPLVSAKTGLLNTPERENKLVQFETIMNPTLQVGGLCQLESTTADYLNGIYKIEQLVIRGDNYGQDWMQIVTCRLAEGYKQIL